MILRGHLSNSHASYELPSIKLSPLVILPEIRWKVSSLSCRGRKVIDSTVLSLSGFLVNCSYIENERNSLRFLSRVWRGGLIDFPILRRWGLKYASMSPFKPSTLNGRMSSIENWPMNQNKACLQSLLLMCSFKIFMARTFLSFPCQYKLGSVKQTFILHYRGTPSASFAVQPFHLY